MTERVLITGSSRGIGKAIALRSARDGYDVVLNGRSESEDLKALKVEIETMGQSCEIMCFDISDRQACSENIMRDIEQHGTYYGVVCNAGIASDNAFPAMAGEQWDRVIHTNLDGFYNVLHPIIMPMIRRRKPSRIITLSSVSGEMGNRGQVNYSAAKAGIIGATKALAIELAKRKITVNCVSPGLIDTEMVESVAMDEALKMIPMKRMGRVEEVAGTVNFLLSEDAAYITRQVISVNGGMF